MLRPLRVQGLDGPPGIEPLLPLHPELFVGQVDGVLDTRRRTPRQEDEDGLVGGQRGDPIQQGAAGGERGVPGDGVVAGEPAEGVDVGCRDAFGRDAEAPEVDAGLDEAPQHAGRGLAQGQDLDGFRFLARCVGVEEPVVEEPLAHGLAHEDSGVDGSERGGVSLQGGVVDGRRDPRHGAGHLDTTRGCAVPLLAPVRCRRARQPPCGADSVHDVKSVKASLGGNGRRPLRGARRFVKVWFWERPASPSEPVDGR